jgi:hypothetical protein
VFFWTDLITEGAHEHVSKEKRKCEHDLLITCMHVSGLDTVFGVRFKFITRNIIGISLLLEFQHHKGTKIYSIH